MGEELGGRSVIYWGMRPEAVESVIVVEGRGDYP